MKADIDKIAQQFSESEEERAARLKAEEDGDKEYWKQRAKEWERKYNSLLAIYNDLKGEKEMKSGVL